MADTQAYYIYNYVRKKFYSTYHRLGLLYIMLLCKLPECHPDLLCRHLLAVGGGKADLKVVQLLKAVAVRPPEVDSLAEVEVDPSQGLPALKNTLLFILGSILEEC